MRWCMPDGVWLDAVVRLRAAREPAVLVTLATVRGHAPRRPGAKMVVSATGSWGSIGGGNVEAVAIERARAQLADPSASPELMTSELSERAPAEHGVQCCGGTVTVLLEPLRTVPAVAIFGAGHVGSELARILARQDIELHLIDTRPEILSESRLALLADAVATVHVHQVPVLPESVVGELPRGVHVLIMTHDHA
jgi:xanthine dehydrogenase accessory factor